MEEDVIKLFNDNNGEDMALQADVSAYAAKLPMDNASESSWIFNSGASKHMLGCMDDFSSLQPQTGTITVAGSN